MMAALVGASDIAKLLGISVERVRQLARLTDFPAPLGHVGGRKAPVWDWSDVEHWGAVHDRLPTPPTRCAQCWAVIGSGGGCPACSTGQIDQSNTEGGLSGG